MLINTKIAVRNRVLRLGYAICRTTTFNELQAHMAAQTLLIGTLNDRIAKVDREANFRRIIGVAAARYFIMHERTPDIAIPFEEVRRDSLPEWVPYLLDRAELSEPEFAVFQFFTNPADTVLDIGAHFGYSATSIWRAGCPAHVLSIEPNPWHRSSLEEIKRLRPGRFDFLGVGLSNSRGSLRFIVPVVDGVGIGGLCSAAIESEMDAAIPENLVKYMQTYTPDVVSPRLQYAETHFPVAPLDEVLTLPDIAIPLTRIAAIKIDVEGLEPEVLEGAVQTLRRHRPMLMIEGANRVASVVSLLGSLGYCYAEFHGSTVFLTDRRSARVGGFYLHESRLDEYRASGLLVVEPREADSRAAADA